MNVPFEPVQDHIAEASLIARRILCCDYDLGEVLAESFSRATAVVQCLLLHEDPFLLATSTMGLPDLTPGYLDYLFAAAKPEWREDRQQERLRLFSAEPVAA